MKSKKNKKRKFKDFDCLNGNDNENGGSNSVAKKYEGKEYKTPLEILGEMFQGISGDTIEEIYISNNRNFVITKQTLELLCNDNDNDNGGNNVCSGNGNKKEDGDVLLENVEGLLKGNNDNKYNKGSNYKNGMDLTRFASFEIDSDIQCDINIYNNNNKTTLSNNSNSNSNNSGNVVKKEESKDVYNIGKKKKKKGKMVDLDVKTGFYTMGEQEKNYSEIYISGTPEQDE